MKEFYHVILLIFTINGLVIAQESIVFLSYNTYNGFQNDTVVMDQYQKWIGKINPSVIAYQEMNNFSPPEIKEICCFVWSLSFCPFQNRWLSPRNNFSVSYLENAKYK